MFTTDYNERMKDAEEGIMQVQLTKIQLWKKGISYHVWPITIINV